MWLEQGAGCPGIEWLGTRPWVQNWPAGKGQGYKYRFGGPSCQESELSRRRRGRRERSGGHGAEPGGAHDGR